MAAAGPSRVTRRSFLAAGAGIALAVLACHGTGPARGPAPAAARFTAALPAEVSLPARVAFYGDSRPRLPVEFWREDATWARLEVIRRLAEERPSLIVHSGDLVANGDAPQAWARFDAETAPIRDAGVPFYPLLGNHEFSGDDAAGLRFYFERFPLLAQRRWYDLLVGPLLVLAVDTNADALSRGAVDAQDAWFRARLSAADGDPAVKWVVVVGHHAPYTNASLHKPDAFTQGRFVVPAMASGKFRVFVSGHVHSYERFAIEGRQFVVSGGGGAPRVDLVPGHRFREAWTGPPQRPFHYLLATVELDRVVFDVMMLDDRTHAWSRGDGFEVR